MQNGGFWERNLSVCLVDPVKVQSSMSGHSNTLAFNWCTGLGSLEFEPLWYKCLESIMLKKSNYWALITDPRPLGWELNNRVSTVEGGNPILRWEIPGHLILCTNNGLEDTHHQSMLGCGCKIHVWWRASIRSRITGVGQRGLGGGGRRERNNVNV